MANPHPVPHSPLRLALVVVLPFSCGYFLSYLYRAINAVVAPHLTQELGLNTAELGLITAAYLYAFAAFQLPLGMILDRINPRWVQVFLLTIAALGSVGFALAEQMITLMVSRLLIGLGFAGGLMASFKAVVLWFPPARHALINGCIVACGGLGLLTASVPAEYVTNLYGWRTMFLMSAVVTLLVAALIALVVPAHPLPPPAASGFRAQLRGLGGIVADGYFWRLAPLVGLASGTQIAIQTLWAGEWFRNIGGYNSDIGLTVMGCGFLIGALSMSAIADWLGRRGVDLMQIMMAGLGVYFVAQLGLIVGWFDAVGGVFWFVFALAGNVPILSYAKLTQHFGRHQASRAHTSINLLVFLCAAVIQGLFGNVLEYFSVADGGSSALGYRVAMGIFFALQLLAFIYFLGHPAHRLRRPRRTVSH